jgi:ATP/maltotriose-dependent transcriptional regulator MalT
MKLAGAAGLFWHLHGHLSEGRRRYEDLFALPQSGVSVKVRARALTLAGALAQWQQDFEQAAVLEQEALSLWWTIPLSEQYLAWGALSILGDAARARGDHAGAQDWYEQLLAHAQRVGGTRNVACGYMQLGSLHEELGDYEQAAELLGQALALARPAGDIWVISMCLGHLSLIALRLGDLARARELCDEAVELARRMGNRSQLAGHVVMLGWLDLAEGRTEAAEARFDEGRALGREVGAQVTVAQALARLGEAALRRGDLDHAEQQYREALTLAQLVGAAWTTISVIEGIARVCLDRGEVEKAVRLLSASSHAREVLSIPRLPIIEDVAIDSALATARQVLPDSQFSAAWAASQSMTLDEATTEAHSILDTVATLVPSAGATQPERRADSAPLPPLTGGPTLTPRELDVLRLVADGKSNQEIGAILFISPHTAARHVTSILTKLSLDSRAAAAAYAVRRGLV